MKSCNNTQVLNDRALRENQTAQDPTLGPYFHLISQVRKPPRLPQRAAQKGSDCSWQDVISGQFRGNKPISEHVVHLMGHILGLPHAVDFII